MDKNNSTDNNTALNIEMYRSDPEKRNLFLASEQDHILHLTARILRRTVTESDDEWSIALLAVNEAIDNYDASRGKFWNYAALVIGSRIKDYYRSNYVSKKEISVGTYDFEENDESDESQIGIKIEIRNKTAAFVDTGLRDELDELTKELKEYEIDLFDLPKCAPKSQKTRKTCREVVLSIFIPPPLIDFLRKTKNLPVKEIMSRVNVKRKLIDRHRKFLIASALIKAGDYPGVMAFMSGDD